VVVLAGLAFLRRELGHRSPIFQPRLFTIRSYAAATTGIAFSNMAMYSLLLAVPLLLASRGTYGEIEIGFVLLALSIAMLFLTPIGGRLADRLGRRAPTFAGLALLSLGTFLIAASGEDIDLTVLIIGLAIVGVGVGLSWPGLQTTAVESVGADQTGVASGLYSTSRYFGSIVGSAILAGLISSDAGDASGIGGVFVLAFVAAILAVVASLFLVARPSPPGESAGQTVGAP
jgi:DHA2 family methylenomycin A resistance protein-like MFS transporter